MTDQSKIPLPLRDKAEPSRDSLIERAAERFDFARYMAAPRPEALPPKREPVMRAKAPAAPKPVETEVSAAAAAVEPTSVRASASVDTSDVGQVESEQGAVQTAVAPAIFSTERHAIDREHLRENGLIAPEGSVTGLLEEFRIVKRQLMVQASELRRQKAGSKAQRVLISSPHPGEGKTYCATNLALSIAAEKDSDVLLVDADFAKPSILSALGLPGGPGLMDALMDDEADVAQFVLGTDIPGLWVLPAGNTTTNDSEYLSSARTEKVLERLTQGAPGRMVIFDSPPALAASPAAELAKYVGQAVVIVRADSTGQGALEDAVSLLSSCPNIQLLLNAAQFSPSGRSFGSYYGYRE